MITGLLAIAGVLTGLLALVFACALGMMVESKPNKKDYSSEKKLICLLAFFFYLVSVIAIWSAAS